MSGHDDLMSDVLVCVYINMHIAYMIDLPVRPNPSGAPKIHNVFQDDVDLWIGYPLSTDAVPHRSTPYLREKCTLSGFFQEMHALFFTEKHKKANVSDFVKETEQLATQMEKWHERLPFELQYDWPMCIGVWELHASYLSHSMTLRLVTRNRCFRDGGGRRDPSTSSDSPDTEDTTQRIAHDGLSKALLFAYKAAEMLRDVRERYGLKIVPPFAVQLSAVAGSVLVLDKDLTIPHVENNPSDPSRPIADSHTAFDEVFRFLLGISVEIMIARGIARMIYYTALEHKIALSRAARAMLQIMADTAWRPSDLALLHSTYPDITTVGGDDEISANRRLSELLSSWENLEI
ncbi:hypothetical protein BST61_g9245 [Cercospora zeina]